MSLSFKTLFSVSGRFGLNGKSEHLSEKYDSKSPSDLGDFDVSLTQTRTKSSFFGSENSLKDSSGGERARGFEA